MIRSILRPVPLMLILLVLTHHLVSATPIRIGSIAPAGTPWDNALREMAQEWRRLSDGRIDLRIFAGGVAGDEADMIRKMRIGQLQAAVLSGIGLMRINRELLVLSLPFFIQNDAELDYTLERSREFFDGLIRDKGFVMLLWTQAGWVRFFSRSPVRTPDELRRQTLSVTAGEDDLLHAWQANGFRAIPLSSLDLMASLQSGMCDAFYTSPILAASSQWFAVAPHMYDLNIAPLVGGIVMSERAWNAIRPELRPRLIEAAERIEKGLRAEILTLEQRAIDIMVRNGLTVHAADANGRRRWREAMRYETVVGTLLERATIEQVSSVLAEFRARR